MEWGLVEELAPPTAFDEAVGLRAASLAASSTRLSGESASLPPLKISIDQESINYTWVSLQLADTYAELKVSVAQTPDWLLQTARELDDALCRLRFDFPEIGSLILRTEGSIEDAAALDEELRLSEDNIQLETALLWKRCLSRLDLMSKTLVAAIEPGSCFVGLLLELALAADRTFMLEGQFEEDEIPLPAATIRVTESNLGQLPMWNDLSRLASRLWGDEDSLDKISEILNRDLTASSATSFGLVTTTPDDLDWNDELRLFIEERSSFSADALTAMEANQRFCGPETMATKIFARLSAWQNWVFTRPNASGPEGSLQRYGTGSRPRFDNRRT